MVVHIANNIILGDGEVELLPIRAQGSGGQNVNKVSSAIHLRFDINSSSLPELYKQRLLALADSRITGEGILVIKAQQHRTQEQNRREALDRLAAIIRMVTITPKRRSPTRPTQISRRKRLDSKTQRGRVKSLRKKIIME